MNLTFSKNNFKGYGEMIAACILWSLAGIFGKMIIGMSAQGIIFYRVTLAFIILFIVLYASGNLDKVRLKGRKKYLILFSLLQVVTMVAYFISILKASVSVAVLLLYTAPVYVTLLSPFILKESFTKIGMIALVISTSGIILIADPGKLELSGLSTGIVAGILSGVSYAFQIMTSKYISTTYSGYAQAFWSFLIAIIILLPIGVAPVEVVTGNISYLLLLAIFPTILAVSLYFNGLNKVRARSASILGLIEPVSAVLLAVLILHEEITALEFAGGALILAGAALVTKERPDE
ncbi:MAG: EamA family transporter [Candidatus Methanoperedens sp.]|nr:EamA family transporter [Candidatus Methanoperedens sp.]MCE8427440.1 EamA family transporter [Candidatus Methanoperedens sp.]